MSSAAADGAMTVSPAKAVFQQHVEWEKKATSLDRQEKEVHQTQLRLIREQTVAFVRDLTTLRHEVASQKVTFDMLQSSLEREKQDRTRALTEMGRKHNLELETMLPGMEKSFKDQLQAMDRNLRNELAREANLRRTESENLSQRLSTEATAREAIEKTLKSSMQVLQDHARDTENGLRQCCMEVQKTLEDKVAAVDAKFTRATQELSRSLDALRIDLQDLVGRDLPGSLATLETMVKGHREQLTKQDNALEEATQLQQQTMERAHNDLKDRLEELHSRSGDLEVTLKNVQNAHGELLQQHGSMEERLEQLHGAHNEAGNNHGELASRHAALNAGVEELKRTHDAAVRTHAEAIEDLRRTHAETMQAHTATVEDLKQTLAETTEDLKRTQAESAEDLKRTHAETSQSHAETMEDLKRSQAESVEDVKRTQIESAEDFQRRHVETTEALAKLGRSHMEVMDSHRAELHGRISGLEQSWKELHTSGQNRISELQEATRNEFNENIQQQRSLGRKWEAHHESIEERLDIVESTMAEYVEKHLRELESAQNRLGDLQMGQAALSRDRDTMRAGSAGLGERIECLEQALGGAYAQWPASSMNGGQGPGQRRYGTSPWRWRGQSGQDEMQRTRSDMDDSNRSQDLREAATNGASFLPSISDRLEDLERLNKRVDVMEGTMAEEHTRIWEALDSHTHDAIHIKRASSPSPLLMASMKVQPGACSTGDASPARMPSSPLLDVGRTPLSSPQGLGSVARSISAGAGAHVYAAPRASGTASGASAKPVATEPGSPTAGTQPDPVASGSALMRSGSPVPSQQSAWSPSSGGRAVGPAVVPSPAAAHAACTVGSCGANPMPPSSLAQRSTMPASLPGRQPQTQQAWQQQQQQQQPWPWPAPPAGGSRGGSFGSAFGSAAEEEHALACGRARYGNEKASTAEASKS